MEPLVKRQNLNRPLNTGELDGNWQNIEDAINILEGVTPYYAIEDFEYEHSCNDDHDTAVVATLKVKLLEPHSAMPAIKLVVVVNSKVRKVIAAKHDIFVGADYPLQQDTLSDSITLPFTLTADDFPASIAVRIYDEKYLTGEPYIMEIDEDLCLPTFTLKIENNNEDNRVKVYVEGVATIDWGDGNVENFDSESANHYYAESEEFYFVTITGTPTGFDEMEYGLVREIKNVPSSLTYLSVPAHVEVMEINNLAGLQSLSISGGTPTFANLVLPTINQLTYVSANDLLLSSATVNAVLANLVANEMEEGSVNLSGQTPPAPPTGQGIVDKGILEGRGWTVTVDSVGA